MIHDPNAFGDEQPGLSVGIGRSDAAADPDDSPPGQILAAATEQSADGSGGAGIAGFLGHLAIGDDVAWLQAKKDFDDPLLEIAQPVFLIPAAIPLTVRRIARCNWGSGSVDWRARSRRDAWRRLIGSR